MHEYYAQENGKIYYAITSNDARENDTTQTSEVSKYQPAWIRQVPVAILSLQQMFEVTAAFPRSNADVCATDRLRRRRYSGADRTTRQSDVASDRVHRE